MSAPAKHIVFDWNGTLLDDAPIIHESINAVLADLNHPPIDRDDFFHHYHIPFDVSLRQMGVAETAIHALTGDFSLFHSYYETRAAHASLRQGAKDILAFNEDRGLRSIILSNHLVEPIRTQLRRHDIESRFATVLAYANASVQFKDMTKGERLRRYFAEHGYDATTALIIGDTIEEAHIARDHGMISVAITGGSASEARLREARPDYLIHSLDELKPILIERGLAA